jgi:hypothetical protein
MCWVPRSLSDGFLTRKAEKGWRENHLGGTGVGVRNLWNGGGKTQFVTMILVYSSSEGKK